MASDAQSVGGPARTAQPRRLDSSVSRTVSPRAGSLGAVRDSLPLRQRSAARTVRLSAPGPCEGRSTPGRPSCFSYSANGRASRPMNRPTTAANSTSLSGENSRPLLPGA
jgi:hypothetical protein